MALVAASPPFFRRWYSRIVKANTGYVEKKNNDGQSLPLEGKVASEASRIGQWRYERAREIVSSAPLYESTRAPLRGPPSPMGKAAIRGCGFSRIVKANTGYVEKKNNDEQSLPRVGKVASKASRIGFWRDEKERRRSSQAGDIRAPEHRCAVPFPQWGRLRYEDAAFLASSKRIQDTWRKRITMNKAFPAWGRWRAKRAG